MKLTDLPLESLEWIRYIVAIKICIEFEESYLDSTSIKNPLNIIKTIKRTEEHKTSINDVLKFHPEILPEHIDEFYQKYSNIMRTNKQRSITNQCKIGAYK